MYYQLSYNANIINEREYDKNVEIKLKINK